MEPSFFSHTVHPYIRKTFICFLLKNGIYETYLKALNMNLVKVRGGLKESDFFAFLTSGDGINSFTISIRYALIHYQTKWKDVLHQSILEINRKKRNLCTQKEPTRQRIDISSLLSGGNSLRSIRFNHEKRTLEITVSGALYGGDIDVELPIDAMVDYVDVVNSANPYNVSYFGHEMPNAITLKTSCF